VARGGVLAMLEQDGVSRIRVGWSAAHDLIVTVRDDGPGRIADRSLPVLELTARAEAVEGIGYRSRFQRPSPRIHCNRAGRRGHDRLECGHETVATLLERIEQHARAIAGAHHVQQSTPTTRRPSGDANVHRLDQTPCCRDLRDSGFDRERLRLDLAGALTAMLGLVILVYGTLETGSRAWGSAATIVTLASGSALLAAFVEIEGRVAKHPLVP
jgi:hypothetical protein